MRRKLVFVLLGLALSVPVLTVPVAAAPRIEAGLLADAPFLATSSAVAVGERVFAVGTNQLGDPGLAVWSRDGESGQLQFERALSRAELGLASAVALAASPDGRFLYLLGRTREAQSRILVFAIEAGSFASVEVFAAGSLGIPKHLALSHDGKSLYAGSSNLLGVYDRHTTTGKLTLRQTLAGASFGHLLVAADDSVVYVAGESIALRSFSRNTANGELTPASTLDDFAALGLTVFAGAGLGQSPDSRFLYLLAKDTSTVPDTFAVLAFEKLGGGLLSLQSRGPGSTSEVVSTAMAIHPQNGTLYLATFDEDAQRAMISSYAPKEEGRDFFGLAASESALAVPGYANVPLALALSADGANLYGGYFEGLPLATFAVAGAAGVLAKGPLPAGVFGLAEAQDFAFSPEGERILAAAPAAGRVALFGWNGELSFLGAPQLAGDPIERLVFVGESRVAALLVRPTGEADLQLFDLAADGTLTARGSKIAVGALRELWLSPDRLQLYLTGAATTRRYEYRPASGTLVSKGLVGSTASFGPVRFSADGRSVFVVANEEALVIPLYHTLFYRFDPASSTLTAEADDPELDSGALDYALSADGNDLYVLKNGSDLCDMRIQLRHRGATGSWNVVAQQLVLPAAASRIDRPAQLALDPTGRRLAILGMADGALMHFGRDPASGALELIETETAELALTGSALAAKLGELSFSPFGNELYLLDTVASKLSVDRWGCDTAENGELCLGQGGKFRVEIDWQTAGGSRGEASRVVAPASDSGLFYFFSENNWEMLVKVLDACTINNHFWVFAAATTDVGYALRVIDTESGKTASYQNVVGTASPAITDTSALEVCVPAATIDNEAPKQVVASRAEENTVLRLRDRFELRVSWTSATGTGTAKVVPFGSADSGIFYFFSDNNWEMLVKVLDGCAINQKYWVLAAATTDVGYTLEVVDLEGGATKRYTNPLGRAAPAIIDLGAFGGCSQ